MRYKERILDPANHPHHRVPMYNYIVFITPRSGSHGHDLTREPLYEIHNNPQHAELELQVAGKGHAK